MLLSYGRRPAVAIDYCQELPDRGGALPVAGREGEETAAPLVLFDWERGRPKLGAYLGLALKRLSPDQQPAPLNLWTSGNVSGTAIRTQQ